MSYSPELSIDNEILNLVADISVLVDRIPDNDVPPRDLKLRRANKIRSIQSSLAIEGNTLSLEKVTDIVNGKRVLGNPREIQEVKNALVAYDMMDSLDPYDVDDLLEAHYAMIQLLIDEPGAFRECGVGVFKGKVPVHIAPEPEDVPMMIDDLIMWARDSDMHPLVKGCIFHCRFEYIHPFVDGNGRMGRMWHSLILSKWKYVFSYLPIETWVKLNQADYYNALTEADYGNLVPFVKFMLTMIRTAVDEFVDELTYSQSKSVSDNESSVLKILAEDPGATAAEIAVILNVSDRTVKRYLSSLSDKGLIKRVGSDKTGHWIVN